MHFLRPRRDRRELAERLPHLGRRHVLSRRHDRRAGRGHRLRARQAQATSPTCWISSRRCPASACWPGGSAISSTANSGASPPICPGDSACRTPDGVLIARHPSQLYEAGLEGLVLFMILWWFTSKPRPRLAPTGSVPAAVRLRPLHGGMGAPAGCQYRLPGGRLADHGHAVDHADDFRRRRHDDLCLSAQRSRAAIWAPSKA